MYCLAIISILSIVVRGEEVHDGGISIARGHLGAHLAHRNVSLVQTLRGTLASFCDTNSLTSRIVAASCFPALAVPNVPWPRHSRRSALYLSLAAR